MQSQIRSAILETLMNFFIYIVVLSYCLINSSSRLLIKETFMKSPVDFLYTKFKEASLAKN